MYKQKEEKMTSTFQTFHEEWHEQLRELVQQLMNKSPKQPSTTTTTTQQQQQELYTKLIQKVTSHIKEYYKVKSLEAKNDILYVFTAPWSNSLERSLYWISGWRPTTAFHIIYTESGILFQSHIVDILSGYRNGDLGDLTPYQLTRFSELQCQVIQQENDISEQLSDWQDSGNDIIGSMGDNIDGKMERLADILERADQLRLRTIQNLMDLLTPQQAVEFLIAAAHLLFGIRSWGINHDRQRAKG